jgi:uncharacterized integral membrane protein
MDGSRDRSDVMRTTRWLAAFIIPFLILAIFALLGFPDDTRHNFAWNIQPPLTAMVLGATYAAGIWFFVRVIQAQRWRQVRVGFPAIGSFATLLGITTFLHWDRFIHQNPGFVGWTALYITTPFLVFGAWFLQRRMDSDRHLPESTLPPPVRLVLGALGAGEIALAVALFVAPTDIGQVWPWTVTALTGRSLAAIFTLSGVVSLEIARDGRWSVARYLLEAQAIWLGVVLVSIVRDLADFHFTILGWMFLVGLGALLAFTAGVYIAFLRLTSGRVVQMGANS